MTVLPSGQVLVAGGCSDPYCDSPLAGAELYDPASGTWTPTGSMNAARDLHTATLLQNGEVLVVGGQTFPIGQYGFPPSLSSAELYNPATGTWTYTGAMSTPRASFTAALLQNGQVLVAGGQIGHDSTYATADMATTSEVYDPTSGTWTSGGVMTSARSDHAASLLPNGSVLVVGGCGSSSCPPPKSMVVLHL